MGYHELGRRDRKKLETYRTLHAAALRLVAERGLHQVTVEDISEAADVSVRTFFNHFPSKEDSIVGLDPEWVSRVSEALAERPGAEPPLVALRWVLGEMGSAMVEQSDQWSLLSEVLRASPSLLPRMLASFAVCECSLIEVIASRIHTDPDRDLYPVLVTAVAMAALRAAMVSWRAGNGAEPFPAIFDRAFNTVAAGLPAPSGSPSLGCGSLSSDPSDPVRGCLLAAPKTAEIPGRGTSAVSQMPL